MSSQLADFERTRTEFTNSLHAVAASMRSCAEIAESFAKNVKDSQYSPELAVLLNGDVQTETKGKARASSPVAPEDDATGPKKRKRNIKPRDPNAPKRPPSSYILYQNEVRKGLKGLNPGLNNAQLLSLISDQWQAMPDPQKATYINAMATAKAKYNVQKAIYDQRTPEEIEAANAAVTAAAALKKANSKPRGPKRPAATPAPEVKARPPPTAEEMAPSSVEDTEEEDEEDEDEELAPILQRPDSAQPDSAQPDSDSSEEEDEDEEESESEPAAKKRRGAPAQATDRKSKKAAKA